MKRLILLLFAFSLIVLSGFPCWTCDEDTTNSYVTRLLFGDQALRYQSEQRVQMLLKALYLCSQQYGDEQGQERLDYLKKGGVHVPSLSEIKISASLLTDCSHKEWNDTPSKCEAQKSKRKSILIKTVDKVFGFHFIDKLFRDTRDRIENFSALLYYFHIFADYLSGHPESTEVVVGGEYIAPYAGKTFVRLNGGLPAFTDSEKNTAKSFERYSEVFDRFGRTGVAFVNLNRDSMPPPGSRQHIGYILPSGWHLAKYPGIVSPNPGYLFNRCHLVAHQLNGNDTSNNLVTGTRYLNENMMEFEEKVANYIKTTGNHVLYRATPIYKGDNLVVSGIQLEAYSVEDHGELQFNVYLYNVQPGIEINYADGNHYVSDSTHGNHKMIPFVVPNPSDDHPDLIYEMVKYLKKMFGTKGKCETLIKKLNELANEARSIGNQGQSEARQYIMLMEYKQKIFEELRSDLPSLLKEERFFKKVFK